MRRAPLTRAKRKPRGRRHPESAAALPPEGLPKVAIVGRPNVGKSTIFNKWVGRRKAVVSATPGTTRDRLSAAVTAAAEDGPEVAFELVDTGGIGIVDDRAVARQVTAQIESAIREADALVLVLDARDGLMPLDREAARIVRLAGKPVVVVANKCETDALTSESANFLALGLGDVVPLSAETRWNMEELRRRVAAVVPHEPRGGPSPLALGEAEPAQNLPDEGPPPRVAVVGRRSAGKSTFVNALAGTERVIVSGVPGTTRDPVDVSVRAGERPLVVIDTAGVGRKRKGRSAPEHFSVAASREAVSRAEAVILVVDATARVGSIEQELALIARLSSRPVVIAVNKWDLAEASRVEPSDYRRYLDSKLAGLSYAPVVFMSAARGERVLDCAALAAELARAARGRRGTGELNRMLERVLAERKPPSPGGKYPKIFYVTQTGVSPPTVTLFVNDPLRFAPWYVKFLENRLRELWTGEGEVPVRVDLRSRPRE